MLFDILAYRAVFAIQNIVQRAHGKGEWGPEFVAHIRKEAAFFEVKLSEVLRFEPLNFDHVPESKLILAVPIKRGDGAEQQNAVAEQSPY